MEVIALAGLAVLCLYAWRYGHVIVGVCALAAGGLYLYALAVGAAALPGADIAPYVICGFILVGVWSVT